MTEAVKCKTCGRDVTPRVIFPNYCTDCTAERARIRRINSKLNPVLAAVSRARKSFVPSKAYETYMQSEEWQIRKELVLARDNWVCQADGENVATEVHHLNYDHFGHEPLFDLVSVCHDCHEQITARDREKRDKAS